MIMRYGEMKQILLEWLTWEIHLIHLNMGDVIIKLMKWLMVHGISVLYLNVPKLQKENIFWFLDRSVTVIKQELMSINKILWSHSHLHFVYLIKNADTSLMHGILLVKFLIWIVCYQQVTVHAMQDTKEKVAQYVTFIHVLKILWDH